MLLPPCSTDSHNVSWALLKSKIVLGRLSKILSNPSGAIPILHIHVLASSDIKRPWNFEGHRDAATVFRNQGSGVATPEAEIPVQDDKAVQDRVGQESANQNVPVQTLQRRVRGGVLLEHSQRPMR